MENTKATLPDERQQEIKQVLNLEVSDMLVAANEAGYSSGETLAALATVVDEQKVALNEDSDPADDPAPN